MVEEDEDRDRRAADRLPPAPRVDAARDAGGRDGVGAAVIATAPPRAGAPARR